MRRLLVLSLLCGTFATIVAAQPSDIFRTLGTTQDEGHNNIFSSFSGGTVSIIGERSVFKTASPEQRATLVRAAIAAARAYASTADFTRRYAQFRESQRPQEEALPQTGAEAMAAQQKQIEEVIRQAQEMIKNSPPEARAELEANIAQMKKDLAEVNADPDYRNNVDAATKEAAREAAANLALRNAEFDKEFPPDTKQLIAGRLRSFLDLSATVDFDAKVAAGSDKKLRFTNPDYEAKPREWKMLYRAGKPAVDAARAAAQDWLKSLGG